MPLLPSWSTRTRSRSRSSQPTSMLRRPPATAKSCWLCKGRLSNTLLPSCCTSWPVRLFWASHESSWGNFHKNSLNPVENYINKVSIRMRLSLVKQWLAEIYSSPRRGGWKEKPGTKSQICWQKVRFSCIDICRGESQIHIHLGPHLNI